MSRLDGLSAIVTGGASGIGRAIALRLAAEGAGVMIADLLGAGARETIEAAPSADSARMRSVEADVSNETAVANMIERTIACFGRVDCVVNNAGVGGVFGSIMDTPTAAWDETFGVLVRGVFLGIKHGARAMVARSIEGSIINVASVAAFSGGNAPPAYSSAKAAVVNLTRSAAVELARYRIRVNCICPGAIRTPLLERGLPPEDPEPVLRTLQPWPAAGRPDDVAGAAAFLASADAAFVTGATLVVDGGLDAAGPQLAARLNAWRERQT